MLQAPLTSSAAHRPEKLPVDKGLKIARSDYNKLLAVKLDILLKG